MRLDARVVATATIAMALALGHGATAQSQVGTTARTPGHVDTASGAPALVAKPAALAATCRAGVAKSQALAVINASMRTLAIAGSSEPAWVSVASGQACDAVRPRGRCTLEVTVRCDDLQGAATATGTVTVTGSADATVVTQVPVRVRVVR